MKRDKWTKGFLLLCCLGLIGSACASSDDDDSSNDGGIDGGTDTDTDTDVDTDTDADTDTDTDTNANMDGGDTVCDEQDFVIEETPVRLVFLLDNSGSMSGTKIAEAKTAINNILGIWSGSQIQFGFDYYPNDGDCGVQSAIPVAPAIGTQAAITSAVNMLTGTGNTPTEDAMNNYISYGYAPGFPETGIETYLVLVTDGVPNCGSGNDAAFSALTTSLLANSIKTFAIGFDYSSTSLNAVAAAGGMPAPYNVPIPATDSTTLQNAFNDIANVVITCVFDIQSPAATADPDNVNFYFDDVVVPQNQGCGGSGYGWQWTNPDHTQMEFCPNSCDEIQDGDAPEIGAKWGCPTTVT